MACCGSPADDARGLALPDGGPLDRYTRFVKTHHLQRSLITQVSATRHTAPSAPDSASSSPGAMLTNAQMPAHVPRGLLVYPPS
eukprot:scaffold25340_cov140-Isochrysis_galbana.AAC.3